MKAIWQGRMLQVTAKVGDQAPMAAVCCNACRTCATTNLLALAMGAGAGALYAAGRLARHAIVRVSPHIHVLYGSTECGVVTHSPWQEIAGRPGAAGRLMHGGVEVAVVDANGAPLPRGSEGRLRFRGATCARRRAARSPC